MNNNNFVHKYTKIFVGNLAWKTTTDDLRIFFQQLGEVVDANVVTKIFPGGISKSKGYGFVTFRDAESTSRACQLPFPIIDGSKININLAYIGAKNNINQSSQNGLHQAGPSHQYHNGLHQAGPSHQYHNGSFSHVASHQYQLFFPNPHFPQIYWDPYYGQCCYMYNIPFYPYSTSMNWHQTNSLQLLHIFKSHSESRIEDITDTDQEAAVSNNEEVDRETNSIVDQQKEDDQEGEISGQDNGIKLDVKDQEVEIVSGQKDDTSKA